MTYDEFAERASKISHSFIPLSNEPKDEILIDGAITFDEAERIMALWKEFLGPCPTYAGLGSSREIHCARPLGHSGPHIGDDGFLYEGCWMTFP